jgi:hypothetical protein
LCSTLACALLRVSTPGGIIFFALAIMIGNYGSSFRGDAKHRTWNLEIPDLVLRTIPE